MTKRKISREELVEIRKREMARKEMESELARHVKSEEYLRDSNERKTKDANPFVVGLIKFVVAMICIEAFVFTFGFFIPTLKFFYAYGHVMIILMSLIPVVMPENKLNRIFEGILRKLGYL